MLIPAHNSSVLPTFTTLLNIVFEDQQFEKRCNRWRHFPSSAHCNLVRMAWQGTSPPWLVQPWRRVPSTDRRAICDLAIGNWSVIQTPMASGKTDFQLRQLVTGESWTSAKGGRSSTRLWVSSFQATWQYQKGPFLLRSAPIDHCGTSLLSREENLAENIHRQKN